MCGINLILDKTGNIPTEAISKMTAATVHRGPDATAVHTAPYKSGQVFFGQNRLKIIDLSDGANGPFRSDDGRYTLLYNGEIYNYQELRIAIQRRGYEFRTESDTEVVLQLLIQEGPRALGHLNGMFALAFYDSQKEQLFLARDRFGIKPLYFAETENFLIVSSEIKAIHQSGLIAKELNENQLEQYLLYKHAAKPQTFYKKVKELKEGTYFIYEQGKSGLYTYFKTPPSKHRQENPERLVQHVEVLLKESLQKHLVSDVPVGLFLSGGIDSTLLLALLHDLGHKQFPVFTITQKNTAKSFGSRDNSFAQLAAKQYNAAYTPFEIEDSLLTETNAFIQHLDQPIADSAALLTSYLAQQVKPYIKVALSGAGADELFAGYNRHRAFYEYLNSPVKASVFKTLVKPIAGILPTGFSHPLRKKLLLYRKLAYKLNKSPRQTFLNFTAMEKELQQLLLTTAGSTKEPDKNKIKDRDWLHWALQHDQHQYLISDILAITDQASMLHSLEVRTPYLENHLQLFLSGLNTDWLLKHGQKWMLKETLAKHHGRAFLKRSKEGFGMPLGIWLRQKHNHHLLEELQNSQSLIFEYLDFANTQELIQRHLRGRHDFSTEIWALIVLAKWLQYNFG